MRFGSLLLNLMRSSASKTPNLLNIQRVLTDFASAVQIPHFSLLQGSVFLPPHQQTLFVRPNQQIIDFPFPSQNDLQHLYLSAHPASFGHGNETVFDLSYRSARTLTMENFAVNLHPDATLLDQIQELMVKPIVEDHDSKQYVRAELYRVNIYGPGDFFKEHQDSPQVSWTGHFGSLVYCLPTEFEGGTFVIRTRKGEEKRLDWGVKFANASKSPLVDVEYFAFAADLVHWIEPVKCGYRVTVTFHLFQEKVLHRIIPNSIKKINLPPSMTDQNKPTPTLKKRLRSSAIIYEELEASEEMRHLHALKASNKLEKKIVLFPLQHQYAAQDRNKVLLKGGDAVLFQMLKILDVNPEIKFYFDPRYDEDENVFQDPDDNFYEIDIDGKEMFDAELPALKYCYVTNSIPPISTGLMHEDYEPMGSIAKKIKIIWAYPKVFSRVLTVAATYGNSMSVQPYYGNICILTMW
jgi:hypothetical protein